MNEAQKTEFHLISFAKLLSNSTNSSVELFESIIHGHFVSKSKGFIYNKFAKDFLVYLSKMVARALNRAIKSATFLWPNRRVGRKEKCRIFRIQFLISGN